MTAVLHQLIKQTIQIPQEKKNTGERFSKL